VIPYFDGHLFDIPKLFGLGPLPIHMFGVLVAMGVILGDRIVVKHGTKLGLEARDIKFLNARIVIVGFIVAHLVSVIFYFPERIKESPLILLNFWAGLSSFGGFLGALLAFLYYTRKEKIPALPYADAVALGLAVGWIFGRTGCFTAHDHPGLRTDFFLGVRYPEGTRHDLGLYELLFTIVMTESCGTVFVTARQTYTAMFSQVEFSSPGTSLRLRWSKRAKSSAHASSMTPKSMSHPVCSSTGPLTASSTL